MGVFQLECRLCGTVYNIGEDSTITTMEDLQQAAFATVVVTDGQPKVRNDHVGKFKSDWDPEWLAEKKAEAPGKADFIQESIASGQRRTWFCSCCDNSDAPFEYPKFEEQNFKLNTLVERADVSNKENCATGASAQDVQRLADLGADAFNLGNYSNAISYFKAALELDPQPAKKRAAIQHDLGVSYASVGNLNGGISLIRGALDLDPDNEEILTSFARALGITGDPKLARTVRIKGYPPLEEIAVPQKTSAQIEAYWKSAGKAQIKNASKELGQYSPDESKIVLAEIDKRNLGHLVDAETRARVENGETCTD